MSIKPKLRLHPDDLRHLEEINDRTRSSSKNVTIPRRALALLLLDYNQMRGVYGSEDFVAAYEKIPELKREPAEKETTLEDLL